MSAHTRVARCAMFVTVLAGITFAVFALTNAANAQDVGSPALPEVAIPTAKCTGIEACINVDVSSVPDGSCNGDFSCYHVNPFWHRWKRRKIGIDIKTVQFGWPMGMPLVRKLEGGLWETRSHLPGGIARVMFTVDGSTMVLLHGFIKRSQATPQQDLATARRRLADLGVKDDE